MSKVLLITSDQSILDPGSSGHMNAREQAVALGELHVLLTGKETRTLDERSLFIHTVPVGMFKPSVEAQAVSLVAKYGIQSIWSDNPFENGVVAMKVAKRANLPFYVDVGTDFLSPGYSMKGMFRSTQVRVPRVNAVRRALAETVLPAATGIRATSERVKSSLTAHYGDRTVAPVVIPAPIGKSLPERVAFPVVFPFSLMAAGRLDAGRRVVDIIDALARIKDQYPGVGLFVVGDGPERSTLERHAKKLKLSERVIFLGDRRDTWGLMQSANVFIQASAHEGYGRRLIQAALARIPIITTDVGIVGEVFKGYDDVLAFPPGDPAALTVHIVGLIEDGQARRMLAISAEAAAKKHLLEAGNIPGRVALFLTGKGGIERAVNASQV